MRVILGFKSFRCGNSVRGEYVPAEPIRNMLLEVYASRTWINIGGENENPLSAGQSEGVCSFTRCVGLTRSIIPALHWIPEIKHRYSHECTHASPQYTAPIQPHTKLEIGLMARFSRSFYGIQEQPALAQCDTPYCDEMHHSPLDPAE